MYIAGQDLQRREWIIGEKVRVHMFVSVLLKSDLKFGVWSMLSHIGSFYHRAV